MSLFAPAAIIFLVSLVLVPGPTARRGTSKSLIWRRKLWEWNSKCFFPNCTTLLIELAGWMGLCLSLATAYFITNGMKNLFGKPRPDLIARCIPDLQDISDYYVGGYGQDISTRWTLVDYHICQQSDKSLLDDGFRSFPSGHASCKHLSFSIANNVLMVARSLVGWPPIPRPLFLLQICNRDPLSPTASVLPRSSPHSPRKRTV